MVRFSKFTKKKIHEKFEESLSKLVWRETLLTKNSIKIWTINLLPNLLVYFASLGIQKKLFGLALTTSYFHIELDVIQLVEGNNFYKSLGNQICG